MIQIYCQGKHQKLSPSLCPTCLELFEYAKLRTLKCPFGEEKSNCSKCKIHCYKKDKREEIKKVMKYAGPRMLFKHPCLALKHFLI